MSRLNDEQVVQEMSKMVAFIKQEALEKARETKIKADEEFQIEKGKLVRQETLLIESFFDKKVRQFEVNCKIKSSHLVNKNRLAILEERNTLLNDLIHQTKGRLDVLQNDDKYALLLRNLALQGFFMLMEKNVTIQARPKDYDLVEAQLKLAAQEYNSVLNLVVEPVIDKENPLGDDSCGGMIISCFEKRIKVTNTLAGRLGLVSEQMMPDMKEMLFGPSPNRKFFN